MEPQKKLAIIIPIVAAIVIAAIVVIIILAKKKPKKKNPEKENPIIIPDTDELSETNSNKPEKDTITPITHKPLNPTNGPIIYPSSSETTKEPSTTIGEPLPPFNTEFIFRNVPNDLKSVTVVQTSNDQSKFNNQLITTDIKRETNYHIFFLSEEDAPPDDQHFYEKMYTGAIAIASECMSIGDEPCELKEMINLTKEKKTSRILEENKESENITLALCLFNITDNDFITSITCHENLPDMKKNEILLDLYFFRSPAIERKDKVRNNITITIKNDTLKNRRYIREKNGGLCNIHNNWGSLCTTDMNITTDLEGNLLNYNEEAITNIVYDKNNSFTKNKKSVLKDHSANITKEEKEKYKKSLNEILEKMKPHMKEDVQFPREKFKELYDLVKNPKNEEEENPEGDYINNGKRRLSSDLVQYIRQKDLFHIDSLGVEIDLNLKINPGLNTDAMRTHLDISFDEENKEIYKREEITNIQEILNQLSALSKAGNILATQLYDKIIEKLETLPNEISIKLQT